MQPGFTPLYMAAQEKHVHVVKYLLDRNANPALATEVFTVLTTYTFLIMSVYLLGMVGYQKSERVNLMIHYCKTI